MTERHDTAPPPDAAVSMDESKARALFTIAGVDVLRVWELPNGYWPRVEDYRQNRERDPWWLVRTSIGLITIGWRKRVIHIDWSDTPVRKIVTTDNVTKTETLVHAWSEGEAITYLRELHAPSPLGDADRRETALPDAIKVGQPQPRRPMHYVDEVAANDAPPPEPPAREEPPTETTRQAHARMQHHADGFQAGWHAALRRVNDGEATEALAETCPDTYSRYLVREIDTAEALRAEVTRLTAANRAWALGEGDTECEQKLAQAERERDEARRERDTLRDWSNSNAASAVIAVEELTALRGQIDALVETVKLVEWAGRDAERYAVCPVCLNQREHGTHSDTCQLAAALSKGQVTHA